MNQASNWWQRTAQGMRLWQWLVLGLLGLANLCLLAAVVPVLTSPLGPRAEAAAARERSAAPASGGAGEPWSAEAAALASVALVPAPVLDVPPAVPAFAAPTPVLRTDSLPPAAPIVLAGAPVLPDEARLEGISGRAQSLPLSCESRSAADWAAYFGVAIDELEFMRRLPLSDNPDFGFVGDVQGSWGQIPPEPYGVHAGPVATLLRQYGLNAYARRGLTWDDLRAQIAAGRPVIAWVVGHVTGGTPEAYTASNGLTTTVARYEHTVILIGYTPERVTVLDGSRIYTRSVSKFLESWSVLGNMAVIRGLLPASN